MIPVKCWTFRLNDLATMGGQIVLLDTVLIMKGSIWFFLLLKFFEKKDVHDFNHQGRKRCHQQAVS